jgi:glucose uptake protein GlcU
MTKKLRKRHAMRVTDCPDRSRRYLQSQRVKRRQRLSGATLVVIGVVCMLVTIGGMLTSFDQSQAVEASSADFAKGIESSLVPSTVGFPLFAGGVILFVVGSWRCRKPRQITI